MTNIFKYTWPMIIIFLAILSSLRLVWLLKNKKSIILYRELIGLFFVIYILFLFHIVTFQDVSWSTQNYTPFKEILRYELGSPLFIRNVLGNSLLFVPYGFFVAYYLKLTKISPVILLTMFTSLVIEFTQKNIGRVFDIDDIILNIIGGVLGFFLYKLLEYLKEHLPSVLKKHAILNIILLVILVIVVFYFINYYVFEVLK